MLTPKRHQLILDLINVNQAATIQELVDKTKASESTIRRDLSELERKNKLVRVHGGAAKKQSKVQELSYPEKSAKNIQKKKLIAQHAANLIGHEESIYLDAGTTTYEMIPYLANKNIIVVTNGLTHIDTLGEYGITTYLLGGYIKQSTRALIGNGALVSINNYRFDKCFLGVNGIHTKYGYTTPDPEEAILKKSAINLSQQSFVLADSSKFDIFSFSKIADLDGATIITNKRTDKDLAEYTKKTKIKVVTT